MQLHEIVLILESQVFVLVMAIYSQENNQNKKYRLSDTNIFSE